MAEFPHMPLFTDAFIADTVHLTASQTGAYIMLLLCAWRSPDGMLPNDEKKLAMMSRLGLKGWSANREAVLSFWEKCSTSGKLYQKRLVEERLRASVIKASKSAAGKASALKKKETPSTDVEIRCNETSTPIPIPIHKRKNTKKKIGFVVPDWIDEKDWNDFEEMRKLKSPLTDNARRGIISGLQKLKDEGNPPSMVLRKSIENRWLGVFPLKDHEKPKPDQWLARLGAWRENRTWLPAWGPKPGENGCRIPQDYLSKHHTTENLGA